MGDGAKRLRLGLGVGALIALATVAIEQYSPETSRRTGQALEEEYGLGWRFWLRGPRSPPDDILIVTPDRVSRAILGERSVEVSGWRRSTHADVIDELVRRNASVIVLDIFFRHRRDDSPQHQQWDRELVTAVRRANRVILNQYSEHSLDQKGSVNRVWTIKPFDELASAARAWAPAAFQLPQSRSHVSWPFFRIEADTNARATCYALSDSQDSAAKPADATIIDVATMQLTALHMEVVHRLGASALDVVLEPLGLHEPRELHTPTGLCALMIDMRRKLRGDDNFHRAMSAITGLRAQQVPGTLVLERLLNAYRMENFYLNYFGPPGTIPTCSYHQLIKPQRGDPCYERDLAGAVVFVGLSELARLTQQDSIPTHVSTDKAKHLSGVEMLATSYANLRQGDYLVPAGTIERVAILVGAAFIFSLIAFGLPVIWSAVLCIAIAAFYVVLTQHQFVVNHTWYPLFVPLVITLPLAWLSGALWQYASEKRSRRTAQRNIRLYVPHSGAEELVSNGAIRKEAEFYGTCLVTDVAGYTTLSEHTKPGTLAELGNEYFDMLDRIVRESGGERIHIHGDSTTNVWRQEQRSAGGRHRACLAAYRMLQAVEAFNQERPQTPLRTRFGMNSGILSWGTIGGGGHFVVGITGDTVNTASRLEQLNKQLGTGLIVSAAVVRNIDDWVMRRLGEFPLRGKEKPVIVYELLAPVAEATEKQRQLCEQFNDALQELEDNRFDHATRLFNRLVDCFPNDGPSRYHMSQLRDNTKTTLESQNT